MGRIDPQGPDRRPSSGRRDPGGRRPRCLSPVETPGDKLVVVVGDVGGEVGRIAASPDENVVLILAESGGDEPRAPSLSRVWPSEASFSIVSPYRPESKRLCSLNQTSWCTPTSSRSVRMESSIFRRPRTPNSRKASSSSMSRNLLPSSAINSLARSMTYAPTYPPEGISASMPNSWR